jgi:UDP-glucose 4-epimerase
MCGHYLGGGPQEEAEHGNLGAMLKLRTAAHQSGYRALIILAVEKAVQESLQNPKNLLKRRNICNTAQLKLAH